MQCAREIIQSVDVPTWMSRTFVNIGSKSHGKLKMDQWRWLCTVHMPIALLFLWEGSEDKARILVNFYRSAATFNLSLLHFPFEDVIKKFDYHIRKYREGLTVLFPKASIAPYQHIVMHLGQMLHYWGPVHSWWTFPFERLLGVLGRVPTNGHISKQHLRLKQPSVSDRL